ncbi:MAG: ribonucleoside-diphosphate reductase subunit alpha [Chlamydiae bacterium RIFCSPHIGHO2_12_FULL_49_11]|nr:MAG: ribonucleoside-diphosphate reductase subunit alpha [Chlamydiae bacterium RIFCSPHIGHO2_12_FULL_49_11]
MKPEYEKLDTSQLAVVKRDGNIVPFHRERIFNAMEAAFRDTKKIPKEEKLPEALYHAIDRMTGLVVKHALELGKKGVALTVEGIQDLVEMTLMKNGYHDVARGYIIYRDARKESRKTKNKSLFVIRNRDMQKLRFNPIKITSSLEKTFRKSHAIEDTLIDTVLIASINTLTETIVRRALSREEDTIEVDILQDIIEEELMLAGYFKEAKLYIIQRAEQELGTLLSKPEKKAEEKAFTIATDGAHTFTVTRAEIKKRLKFMIKGHENEVSLDELVELAMLNFYEGIHESEVDTALVMAARSLVEKEPAYSFVTAKILLDKLYKEATGFSIMDSRIEELHQTYFVKAIKLGVSEERYSSRLLEFDLSFLAGTMEIGRDALFQYLGLQTLYDRYFVHVRERRIETPQIFWMRVAMGLALNEEDKNEKAVEFYNLLSEFYYTSATPTLFNSGTMHAQLSSCYLSTVDDDLSHIFKVISDDAQLSKWAGGLGNDWTSVRATGSVIKGTNGRSQGVIPFLKVANDTAVAVNQGGKRKGALCSYLETWHLDIEDFLELRKNTGDERRRTHDMNTANWICDLFMQRVQSNGTWTLFSPSDTPDLHDLYGKAFKKRYEEYEALAADGRLKLHKKIQAVDLWRKMLSMLFETGHPWITFKDPSNIRSPQSHKGVVHSSNLCTEILLNTSKEEVAVCNLGSVNLTRHVKNGKIDEKRLETTVTTAIRMLDNVIDINFYPIEEAKTANLRHRAIGLGIMGFQDILYSAGISYAGFEAADLADEIMESVSYYAILASSKLAKERGTYSSYEGSKWSRDILPIDSIDLLEEERGERVEMDRTRRKDWTPVQEHIRQYGMRNCNTMAIAPTATIANIIGVTASIEPTYKNLFVKSNLSGEFTVLNTYLVEKLKSLNLWDSEMLEDLKYFDGSVLEIERIPQEVKKMFVTAFEMDSDWLIECGSRRQKWIDMGLSLNLYLSEASGKKMHEMYFNAWKKGLKTTYYLRTQAATQIEKSTVDINKKGLQPRWMKSESASSRIKVERGIAAACPIDGSCESCQ